MKSFCFNALAGAWLVLALLAFARPVLASDSPAAVSTAPAPPKPPPSATAPTHPAPAVLTQPTPAIPTLALGFNRTNATSSRSAAAGSTQAVPASDPGLVADALKERLELARYQRTSMRGFEAAPALIELLGEKSPDSIRKAALLELAAAAEDNRDLARAQQIYGQYLQKWPDDQYVPEVLLRQGHLFRQQGLNRMALAKFYAVMTSALALKHDQLEYYARLVIEAQTQVAETHFLMEKFTDAAEFYSRLLKLDSPHINRLTCQFRLITCLVNSSRFEDAIAKGTDFLNKYPDCAERPEVRFHLASALKQLGRNNESLAQVLALLREQSAKAASQPQVWAYWQQRTGNIIANQLFREGDYTRALEIYLGLARLDASATWQLPVSYQIGQTYERLWQPQKAIETYSAIVQRETELGTNATPGLKAVVDMARWRIGFVQWQSKAEMFTQGLNPTNPPTVASLPVLDSANQ